MRREHTFSLHRRVFGCCHNGVMAGMQVSGPHASSLSNAGEQPRRRCAQKKCQGLAARVSAIQGAHRYAEACCLPWLRTTHSECCTSAVSESVPKYIKLALHLVHESGLGSALMSSEDLTKTLAAMSAQEGKAFDKPVSRHKIHDFVKVRGGAATCPVRLPLSKTATLPPAHPLA